jgi:hypothetical protein
MLVESSLFRLAVKCICNNLTGLRWLRKSFKNLERPSSVGLRSWADGFSIITAPAEEHCTLGRLTHESRNWKTYHVDAMLLQRLLLSREKEPLRFAAPKRLILANVFLSARRTR